MKKNAKRIIEILSWLPAILVVLGIFILSSQSGDASTETSTSVAILIADKTRLEVDFNDIEKLNNFDAWNKFIRTAAHLTEYAFLAFMIAFAVSVNGFSGKLRFFYICLCGAFISVCDEFYQIFVPGRYGDLIDVVFDSASVLIVAFVITILERFFEKWKHRSDRKDRQTVMENSKSQTDRQTLPELSENQADRFRTTDYVDAQEKKQLVEESTDSAEPIRENDSLEKQISGHTYRRPFMSSYIDSISLQEVLTAFQNWIIEKKQFHYIVTPNADHMVMLERNKKFREIYEHADLILTDGQPLMWIAESLKNPITEKIPGSDLLPHVCEIGAKLKAGIFILGTRTEIAKSAAERMKQDYPGLRIAGMYSPDMGFDKNMEQQEIAISKINESNADILVIALGAPKQENFAYTYRDRLNVSLALPIGASIDFMAGAVKRAPKWMRKSGLEWLYRFLQEPGRLFRRYFIEDMKIFLLAWKYRHQIREGSHQQDAERHGY